MQKKTYKMTSKTDFIGTFCCVDSLNDRKWLKCSYKKIKNATTDRYHVFSINRLNISSLQSVPYYIQHQNHILDGERGKISL